MANKEIESKKETREVTMCMHCQEWDGSWQTKTESGRGYCGELDILTPANWWCADGMER